MVGTAVIGVAGRAVEGEVGGQRNGDREDEKHGPGEAEAPRTGLINADPLETGRERLQINAV